MKEHCKFKNKQVKESSLSDRAKLSVFTLLIVTSFTKI